MSDLKKVGEEREKPQPSCGMLKAAKIGRDDAQGASTRMKRISQEGSKGFAAVVNVTFLCKKTEKKKGKEKQSEALPAHPHTLSAAARCSCCCFLFLLEMIRQTDALWGAFMWQLLPRQINPKALVKARKCLFVLLQIVSQGKRILLQS